MPAENTPSQLPYIKTVECIGRIMETCVPERVLLLVSHYPKDAERFSDGLSALLQYTYSSTTRGQIAQEQGVSEHKVTDMQRDALTVMWSNSPPEIKDAYPLHQLTRSRPFTLEAKIESSIKKNGIATQVMEELKNGKTPREIVDEHELSYRQISLLRETLKGWGIEFPNLYPGHGLVAEIKQRFKEGYVSDSEKQQWLDMTTFPLFRDHHGPNDVYSQLKEAVDQAGYRTPSALMQIFAEEIISMKIPFRVIVHLDKTDHPRSPSQISRFFFRVDLDRAVMAIKYNPKFDKYKKPEA